MNGESSQLFDFAIHTHVSRVCRGSPGAGAKGNIIPFCIYYEIKAYNVSCAIDDVAHNIIKCTMSCIRT